MEYIIQFQDHETAEKFKKELEDKQNSHIHTELINSEKSKVRSLFIKFEDENITEKTFEESKNFKKREGISIELIKNPVSLYIEISNLDIKIPDICDFFSRFGKIERIS